MPRRCFRPSIFGTTLMLFAVALFLALAWWQWQRAQQKGTLQHRFEQSRLLPPLELGMEQVDVTEHRFQRIRASGRYWPQQTVLVDNVVHNGQAGYAVITPLLLADDSAVAVDRGWVAVGRSRSQLPEIESPAGAFEIVGSIDRPLGKPFGLNAEVLQQSVADRVWPWLDLGSLAERSGRVTLPYLIRLEKGQPGAFAVRASRFDAKVGMHIAYAVQWGAFALVAFALYLRFSLHPVQAKNGE